MKIVIAGAGAVGSHLAALLSREDQDIILIDESPEKTARLLNSSDLDLMTLNVSPTSIRGLREGGVLLHFAGRLLHHAPVFFRKAALQAGVPE